jgi:hypothetical protein
LDLVVQEDTMRRSLKRMTKVKKRQSEHMTSVPGPAAIMGILATRHSLESEAGIIAAADVAIGSEFGSSSLDNLDLVTGLTTDLTLGVDGVSTNTNLDSVISSDLLGSYSAIDVSSIFDDDALTVTTNSEDKIITGLQLN